MTGVTRIVTGLGTVVGLAGRLAAWICVALVLLVAGDVFARYFFRTGTVWLQELRWHLISPIALFGMAYALLCGEQVRVDVFHERFPPGIRRGIEIVGGVLMIGLDLIMAWLSIPRVEMAYLRGEGSSNPEGLPYRLILKSMIPIGFVLLALQGLAHLLRHVFATDFPPEPKA